ncbi:thioredoxin [Patescibacteria group bacterium]
MALNFTDENFKSEVLEAKEPVFVDFFAEWCGPCQAAGPVIDELAKEFEGKVKIGKLNVDDSPQTAQKYQVMSIPTVVIFKEGKEVKRAVGFPGKDGYKKLIDSVLGS